MESVSNPKIIIRRDPSVRLSVQARQPCALPLPDLNRKGGERRSCCLGSGAYYETQKRGN